MKIAMFMLLLVSFIRLDSLFIRLDSLWIVYRIIVQNIIKISSILKKSELGFSFWKKSLN